MKFFYSLALLLLFITQETISQQPPMPGSYKMLKQMANFGSGDTAFTNDQFKIYTDRHFMFVSQHISDSLGEYGIGTYKIVGDSVVENIIHSTFSDNIGGGSGIGLKITKLPKGYRQVIKFMDSANRPYLLTEEYENVGNNVKSPLDGAWKQTKNVYYSKSDSSINNITQYKIYYAGHFIWAGSNTGSATGRPITYFGYGTFKMTGKNKSVEVNQNSSLKSMLVGKPISLKIEMMGSDTYKQINVSADGNRNEETYERLK